MITGLPVGKGKAFLECIKGQLSDGYWENSSFMEGYWKYFCVEEIGGCVVLEISNRHVTCNGYRLIPNRFRDKEWRWILRWFASKARDLAKAEAKDWPSDEFRATRGNKGVSKYFSHDGVQFTGHDVWLCIKMLEGLAKAGEDTHDLARESPKR